MPGISPLSLALRPASSEREYWAQPHVREALLSIDRLSFVMSTANLYSGWNAADALASRPAAVALKAACGAFFAASLWQQHLARNRTAAYLAAREALITALRLARGAWMVVFLSVCSAGDMQGYFFARKAARAGAEAAVLQALAMAALILGGQCLIWPLPFRRAAPLQFAYVAATFALMRRSVGCALAAPALAPGAAALCARAHAAVDALTALLAEGRLGPGLAGEDGGGGGACGGGRAADALLLLWLLVWALALPLYVLYVRELSQKQVFCRLKSLAGSQRGGNGGGGGGGNSGGLAPPLGVGAGAGGAPLRLGALLHATAAATLCLVCAAATDLLLPALPPLQACLLAA
ncbi:hypothetical protein HT031_004060 [Scenedesmus sp. PABB004]|nr:hypothetical protein HT031_004060 [Scenedesmus sp. PABB004]